MATGPLTDCRTLAWIFQQTVLKKATYNYGEQTPYFNTFLLRIGVWNEGRTSLTGDDYVNGLPDDYVSITITNMTNHLVSGEFSAKLTKAFSNPREEMIITDGVFENLEIEK